MTGRVKTNEIDLDFAGSRYELGTGETDITRIKG